MGVRLVTVALIAGALWNIFTTFCGITWYFDLPMDPQINPVQFTFALVLTALVFGLVIATHIIWNLKQDDLPALLLKAAWAVCIAVNLIASWQGTKLYVFYGDDGDAARGIGLALATAVTVTATIFLSRLVLDKAVRTKPFLF